MTEEERREEAIRINREAEADDLAMERFYEEGRQKVY